MKAFWNRAGVMAIASVILLSAWSHNARAQSSGTQQPGETVGEKIGEKIDQAARDIRVAVEDASRVLRGRFQEAKGAVDRMGTEARIYGRLHWDKALQDASDLAVEMREDGVAVLRGHVPNAVARARAVELAHQTVGVNQVTDELTVGPAPKTTTTPAPDPGARP